VGDLVKRGVDVLGAAAGLVVLSPLLLDHSDGAQMGAGAVPPNPSACTAVPSSW
jgi:hypothetical protein